MIKQRIVIVGGGAGGLELAVLLGRKLGKADKATITLVDSTPTHLWKPLLHEIAAGTMNSFEDELDYMMCASQNYFNFALGTMQSLSRDKREIVLAPISYHHHGDTIPKRSLNYDILIIAVGAVANDFSTPGAKEYCMFLDNREQADYFHRHLLNSLMHLPYQTNPEKKINIAVIGGGATGIELIAELHSAIALMANYEVNINPADVAFTLIEAGDKLLPALTERLSNLVKKELVRLGVKIYLGERVTEVTREGLMTHSGKFIAADIKVWTAGIKAPEFLQTLDGLEVNRLNQLVVKQTLQTTVDDNIFALGDCGSCPMFNNKFVPPRAQAAHQEAIFLSKALINFLKGKPLPLFYYQDYGSLITLGHWDIIGNLMGKIAKNVMVEGWLARLFYKSLYKQHQMVLYGPWRVTLLTMANILSRKVKPRLKLH